VVAHELDGDVAEIAARALAPALSADRRGPWARQYMVGWAPLKLGEALPSVADELREESARRRAATRAWVMLLAMLATMHLGAEVGHRVAEVSWVVAVAAWHVGT